jgi:plastocyanin
MPEFWIQLENRPWDVCPHNIDRMTGEDIKTRETVGTTPGPSPVSVTLVSVNGGPGRTVQMFKPLTDGSNIVDALIYRRYKPPAKADLSDAWTVPDDRKINAWDLNEPDPSENGTMGTIPGPVIEGNVGDNFIIHFRNMDNRKMPVASRCHSIHPHGVVFKSAYDGAFPLSPSDSTQPLGSEAVFWNSVPGFTGLFKKGDRVPPGGTFTYHWDTFGWPTTAGVWLYHDHSICDDDNIRLGAIGFIVVHNPKDPTEVDIRLAADPSQLDPAFLPGGSPNGSPVIFRFIPFPLPLPIPLPSQIDSFIPHDSIPHAHDAAPHPPAAVGPPAAGASPAAAPEPMLLQHGDSLFQVAPDRLALTSFGFRNYRAPPIKQLTLQLFHALGNDATCINGRQYLGNTPTIVSGPGTQMRFGVVGMGSEFHTFHLHGHRWVIPGPGGNSPAVIQGSVQDNAVSQFEDTRTFGPANSFVFAINGAAGSFMRAGGPSPNDSLGEWHMHCHVMMHMMTGMMGSLLIVQGGEAFTTLPAGVPCPDSGAVTGPGVNTVLLKNFAFNPATVSVKVGDTVHWVWQEDDHSVTADNASFDSGVQNTGATFDHMFMTAGTFPYFCKIHGAAGGNGMSGKVIVTP